MPYKSLFEFSVLCCLVCCIFPPITRAATRNFTLSLKQGQGLKGRQITSVSGSTVFAFYGIPYAIPPTGSRRFKPPEPAPDWSGVKDAVTESDICPQFTDRPNSVGSEDCLYLNVFSPNVNASLPVLVWIHGGHFGIGSAFKDGNGITMAPHGIVAVTINYRLGPFGFMSTGDSVMPGNYGMLDQVLALKWVHKYIKAFGGNPSQVTIAGGSAGAFSVSLLIVSPLAKGLFHRGILESGSALSLTAVERAGKKVSVRDSTLRSAQRLGCNGTSSEILHCLQNAGVHHLMNASRDVVTLPRIETTFGFLTDYPVNLLKSGNYNQVDTLHGTNSGEHNGDVHDPENDGITRQQFLDTVKGRVADFINSEEITRSLLEVYEGNETDPTKLRTNLVHEVADVSYGASIMVELDYYVSNPNTSKKHYLYEFDYRITGTSGAVWRGVDHTAERRFVFYPDSRYVYQTATDKAVGEAVQSMWVNFVKYGDPTPPNVIPASTTGNSYAKWNAFTRNSPNMLKIDANSTPVTYPRPFVRPLYEKILQILQSSTKISSPIVG